MSFAEEGEMSADDRKDAAILEVVHHNRKHPPVQIDRRWSLFGFYFHYKRRSSRGLMGRFGGGWNWKFGFQIGGSTVILNLLVANIRITRKIKTEAE